MGQVVPFIAPGSVEDAWEAYRAHAAQALDNPRLVIDRAWMGERRRLEREWQRLFDRTDG